MDNVISGYLRYKNIKKTADMCEVSPSVVRKCLVTAGMYESDRLREITGLSSAGMSPHEISERLGISASTVCIYLPYGKGPYLDVNPSKKALALRRYRARKKAAEEAGK